MKRAVVIRHEVAGAVAGRHGFWAVPGGDSASARALSRDPGPDAWLVDVPAGSVLQFTEGRERPPVDAPATAFLGRLGFHAGWRTGPDWPPLLRSRPPSLAITQDAGEPMGAYARHRLTLCPDGRFHLVASHADGALAWEGRCRPDIVARLCDILADCDFPRLPEHPIQPGPSVREWTVTAGDRSASAPMARFPLETIPPFDILAIIADGICAQARHVPVRGLTNRLEPVVLESRRIPT